MKGNKTYRHEQNPKEKELHDKFIKEFLKNKNSMEQISMPLNERGNPIECLSKKEKEIMISTIQWLGSPVGQSFLNECGFVNGRIRQID